MSRFVTAMCQLGFRDGKAANVKRALDLLDEAAAGGTDFVAFPEMTISIGPEEWFAKAAEVLDSLTTQRFSEKAREHGVSVYTGSFFKRIPDSGRVYNTSALIGLSGEVLDTYRRVHLLDIELDGSVEHRESGRITLDGRPVTVSTDLVTFGLSICYDLRFPGFYRAMVQSGANVLFILSVFAIHTGRDHRKPLLRARAIENQAYATVPDQIGDKPSQVGTYGHTLVVDPQGNVISRARGREEVVTATVDLLYLDEIHCDMQTLQHTRPDVYERSEK